MVLTYTPDRNRGCQLCQRKFCRLAHRKPRTMESLTGKIMHYLYQNGTSTTEHRLLHRGTLSTDLVQKGDVTPTLKSPEKRNLFTDFFTRKFCFICIHVS